MYKHKNMEKRQRFSIRKLTVGTCSVIIGAFFFGTLQPVSASEVAGTEVVATATATENGPNHEAVQNTEEKSGEAVSEVTAADTQTPKNSSEEKPVTEASAKEGTEATSQEGTGEVTNKEEKATEATATEHVETGKTETGAKAEEAKEKEDKTVEKKSEEEKAATAATGENREATEKTAPTKEWDSSSRVKGKVEVVEEGGVRYNKLTSTSSNDNGANEALFEKQGLQADEEGNVNIDLTFKANTAPAETRFGVYLKYKDNDNNIFVGYDKGGWFWQYKGPNVNTWYSKTRVEAPNVGEENHLSIVYKKDGQLNATNNG